MQRQKLSPFPNLWAEISFAKMPFLGTHLRQLVRRSHVAASPPSAPVPGLSVHAAGLEHRPTSGACTALAGLAAEAALPSVPAVPTAALQQKGS